MGEDVDNDDHLSMIAKANGKAPADRHDTRQTNRQSVRFDLGTLKDELKTPLNAALVGSVAILAFAVILQGFYFGGELATARANAQEANSFGHQAERQAKIAEDKFNELRVQVGIVEGIIEAYGLPRPKREENQ